MKKFIFGLLFILSFIYVLYAAYSMAGMMLLGGSSTATTAAGCTTANDSEIVNYTGGSSGPDQLTATTWGSQQFILAAGYYVTEVIVEGLDTGDDTGNITLLIQGNDGENKPDGNTVAGSTVNVALSTVGGVSQDVSFVFSSPLTMAAGTYQIVLKCTGGTSPFFSTLYGAINANVSSAYSSDSGSTWAVYTDDYEVEVYGCAQ